MTIVCATHFTDSSSDAVAVATHLARRTRQRLWLVTVLPGVPVGPSAEGPRRETTVNNALHLEASVVREQGVEVEVALLHGKMERAVGRLCDDVNARLLVVGDSSHNRPSLFATPVDRLAYGVSVPLLVVRNEKPFEAWARGLAPLKVLLAIDHTWSSALAREWLAGLAVYGPLEVIATHIWSPVEEFARRGKRMPLTDADEDSMAAMLMKETEVALEDLPPNVTTRVQLELGRGPIGMLLLDVAARERVDLMVLGSNPHKGVFSRLTSISHEVLANSLMSVALIPGEGPMVGELARNPPPLPEITPHR